jgi:23S rRNA (uracil1939-C5)-methyltransferase
MSDDLQIPSPFPPDSLHVESMDLDAQGVAHRADGKVVFVEGALPFEQVSAQVNRKKNNWEQAILTVIHRESSQRVTPGCSNFGLHKGACGGCKMQHLHPAAQVAVKQRALEDNLWHLGKVKAATILRPIEGPTWGYRYRARLSVRYVQKRGEVLIGFHERKSRYVADMRVCPVLPRAVEAMLVPLRALIGSMDARETCPQIELAAGDDLIALVLRHLEPLSAADLKRLRDFATEQSSILKSAQPAAQLSTGLQSLQWWLQPKGPDTVHLLSLEPAVSDADIPVQDQPELAYGLPEFGVRMPFKPTDFTQVNPYINRVLVSRALRLLAVQKHERVIDWFCGLGNFTLPLATQAESVLGVEGSETLVARSRQNLQKNIATSAEAASFCATEFVARNLFEMTPQALAADGHADKWLVDPPREGAFALVKALVDLVQNPELAEAPEGASGTSANKSTKKSTKRWSPPQRIVYVSCNPSTLARDAGLLVHQAGYRCVAAGAVNMFPHTAHVESMAVFELPGTQSPEFTSLHQSPESI